MENNELRLGRVDVSAKFTLPLQMKWKPKEDITVYELAMCLPFFFRNSCIMPYEVDRSLPHFRHFEIIDPNSTEPCPQ